MKAFLMSACLCFFASGALAQVPDTDESNLYKIPALQPSVSNEGVDESADDEEEPQNEVPPAQEMVNPAPTGDGRIMGDLGLELSFATGLNLCVPRGEASCTDMAPGPYYSLGFQYRFWRLGLALSYASGKHFALGTGSENVSVSTDHFILDLVGYFPTSAGIEPFAAVGLGYGNLVSRDDSSDARVEWSSIWQTVRLSGGVRGVFPEDLLPGEGWFWEGYGSFYLHQGGERCVFYQAQGACRLSEELSGPAIDYASTMELGGKVGWSF